MSLPTKDEVVSAFGEYAEILNFTNQDGKCLVKADRWVPEDVYQELRTIVVDSLGGQYSSVHQGFLIPCRWEEAPTGPAEATFVRAADIQPGKVEQYAGLKAEKPTRTAEEIYAATHEEKKTLSLPCDTCSNHHNPCEGIYFTVVEKAGQMEYACEYQNKPLPGENTKPHSEPSKPAEIKLQPWPRMVEFLPLLSTAEKEALAESLKQYGLKHPILALKDGRIIDGYHRWQILGDSVPKEKIEFVDLDEETAFGLGVSLNFDRRHLSPEIIREKREWQRKAALDLRNKSHYTQERTAKIVGVSQKTVSNWENTSNIPSSKASKSDLRLSIPKAEQPKIVERVKADENEAQIAADYKISQQRISQIVSEAAKQKAPSLESSKPAVEPLHVFKWAEQADLEAIVPKDLIIAVDTYVIKGGDVRKRKFLRNLLSIIYQTAIAQTKIEDLLEKADLSLSDELEEEEEA